MRTKKIRLGMIVAALAVAVSGPAVGAAQSAAAWAESGVAEPQAVVGPAAAVGSIAGDKAPVVESASLASYDWN